MILKLIIVIYSWAWNVEPWQPSNQDDFVLVAMISLFAGPLAVILTAISITNVINKIKRIKKENK